MLVNYENHPYYPIIFLFSKMREKIRLKKNDPQIIYMPKF